MLLLAAICVGILWAMFGFATLFITQDYAWHEKLTITLEAAGQRHTVSRVYEAKTQINAFDYQSIHRPKYGIRGESIVITIPQKGTVVARLSGFQHGCPIYKDFNLACIAQHIFRPAENPSNREIVAFIQKQKHKPIALPAELYPDFLYVPDASRIEGMKLIPAQDVSSVIGEDVHISDVTLEITDEPLSPPEIYNLLPWIKNIPVAGRNKPKLCTTENKCEELRPFDFRDPVGLLLY